MRRHPCPTVAVEGGRRDRTASARVLRPAGFVEIHREQETRLVQEERMDARDERLAIGILARKVAADDLIGDRKEATVGTVGALDAGLLADPAKPLVRAGG